jgi:cytochrome bd ubiquinol oxidase subunit I
MSQETLVALSRWQWALTAGFHVTLPAVTPGTSVFPVICYTSFLRTGQEVYLRMFRFWRRIFAGGFGLGVVAGIVLTFEFGLNGGLLNSPARGSKRADRKYVTGDLDRMRRNIGHRLRSDAC